MNLNSNGGGNYQNQPSVSTRFTTFNSETSLLTVSGWNHNLSIRITPALPQAAGQPIQYDKNRFFQTALTQETAKALYLAYKSVLEEDILTNAPEMSKKSAAVPIGRDDKRCILSIERIPNATGHDLWLCGYSALDNNNASLEQNIFRHKFKKTASLSGYNGETGQAEVIEQESDFFNFIGIVKRLGDLLPLQYHADKYEKQIMAQYSSRNNGQGGYGNNNGYGNSNYGNQQSYGNGGGYNPPAPYNTAENGYSEELPFN